MLAIKFLLLVVSVFLGYFLGYFLTETKYRLARYDVFRMMVWECRKCLSTHITWVTTTFISLLFNDWIMFTIGLFFAAMLFIGLYLDEKNKTVKIPTSDEPLDIEIIENGDEIIINKSNDK